MHVINKFSEVTNNIDYREGAIILVDKPLEWTSFDVVNKIRYKLRHYHGIKKLKVGHNGTLDPLATGLLMVFTGKYTKLIPSMESHDKTYRAVVKFGAETESFDRETAEINQQDYDHISKEKICEVLNSFTGEMKQEIPFYSASKQGGVAMHRLMRQGIQPERKFKKVIFHRLELLEYEAPFATIDVECSKGTYIRTLARDIGNKLMTSSYLYGLRRTAIDVYNVNEAVLLEDFCKKIESIEYQA